MTIGILTNRICPLLAGILLALCLPVRAADVTITVNGRVVAKPCVVSTTSATVDLGALYTTDMLAANSTSVWQTVSLDLTNCPVGTTQVTATFSGTADSSGNYYANQGAAGNIALQLADNGGANLPNGSARQLTVNYPAQTVSFPLQVRAVSVNGRPTEGTIQATVNVTYTYS